MTITEGEIATLASYTDTGESTQVAIEMERASEDIIEDLGALGTELIVCPLDPGSNQANSPEKIGEYNGYVEVEIYGSNGQDFRSVKTVLNTRSYSETVKGIQEFGEINSNYTKIIPDKEEMDFILNSTGALDHKFR